MQIKYVLMKNRILHVVSVSLPPPPPPLKKITIYKLSLDWLKIKYGYRTDVKNPHKVEVYNSNDLH